MQSIEAKRHNLLALAAQFPDLPKVARLATSLATRFKPTVAASLERASDLARWLYIYGKLPLALEACRVLHDVPFANDYNKWTWVEYSLCLKWKLLTQAGQPARAQECLVLIRAANALGTPADQHLKASALQNRLAGALLKKAEIAEAELFANKALAKAWRFAQVGELLYMQALGGSEAWPLRAIEQQLAEDLLLLRALR